MRAAEENGTTANAITDLQGNWDHLKHVDRARAVHEIHKAGVSLRSLAKALNCSESSLRHLNLAAQAPAHDQALARQGKISTRELARRAKEATAQQLANEREIVQGQQTEAAQQGSRIICDWLEKENHWPSHGEAIIDEARMILFGAERNGTLPEAPPPPLGTPVAEIIRRCQPRPETNEDFDVARYARWLAIWAFHAFPDTVIRDRALNLALDKQIRG
jgi:hypothetical protein